MVSDQIERLHNDSVRLEAFITELKDIGDVDKMKTIIAKKNYLEQRLAEIKTS